MTCHCHHPREAHVITAAPGDAKTEPCEKCGCTEYEEER